MYISVDSCNVTYPTTIECLRVFTFVTVTFMISANMHIEKTLQYKKPYTKLAKFDAL